MDNDLAKLCWIGEISKHNFSCLQFDEEMLLYINMETVNILQAVTFGI